MTGIPLFSVEDQLRLRDQRTSTPNFLEIKTTISKQKPAASHPILAAYIINTFYSLFSVVIIACPKELFKPSGQASFTAPCRPQTGSIAPYTGCLYYQYILFPIFSCYYSLSERAFQALRTGFFYSSMPPPNRQHRTLYWLAILSMKFILHLPLKKSYPLNRQHRTLYF